MDKKTATELLERSFQARGYTIEGIEVQMVDKNFVGAKLTLNREDGCPITWGHDWLQLSAVASSNKCYLHPDPKGDKSKVGLIYRDHFREVLIGLQNYKKKVSQSYWYIQGESTVVSVHESIRNCLSAACEMEDHLVYVASHVYFAQHIHETAAIEHYYRCKQALGMLRSLVEDSEFFTEDDRIPSHWR